MNLKQIFETLIDGLRIGQKDLTDFIRDRIRIISFIIMPIFMMIMTGFIFPSEASLKETSLGLVNLDTGQMSSKIVQIFSDLKLSSNQKAFKIKNYSGIDEAKDKIKTQEINGAIVIPTDFSQKIASNQQADLIIIPDQSNPQISTILTQVIQRIVAETSYKVAKTKVGSMITIQGIDAASLIQPITTQIENLVPGKPNYFQFVAPGVIALIMMMAVMTGLAASISREKEVGTLDGLLIAPISRLSIILGKTFAQIVRGLFQGLVILFLAILVFGIHIYGSWLIMILLLILGVFAFIGVGILVSAFASEQETAMMIMMTFQFPMMFLSGAFFPVQQMPQIMQYISKAIPLTYAIEALRKVIILGAGFTAVWPEILILSIFGIVTLAIAVPIFKRVITR